MPMGVVKGKKLGKPAGMTDVMAPVRALLEAQDYKAALQKAGPLAAKGQVEAQYLQGVAASHLQLWDMAEAAFKSVIAKAGPLPDVLDAMARMWLMRGDKQAALGWLDKAAQAGWTPLRALRWADALLQAGQLDEALRVAEDCRVRVPGYADAAFFVASNRMKIRLVAAGGALLNDMVVAAGKRYQQLLCVQQAMILRWCEGDRVALQALCHQARSMLAPWWDDVVARRVPSGLERAEAANMFALHGYWSMLSRLVQVAPEVPDVALPPLVVVGDSHCLPPHGQRVAWCGQPHVIQAEPVVGIKAWHVAQGDFAQAALLAKKLAGIPAGAAVLVSVGEIDTRVDEGMWVQVQRGRATDDVLVETLGAAAAHLGQMLAGRRWGVLGFPAPSAVQVQRLPEAARAGYVSMLAHANRVYAAAVQAAGGMYGDMYALTATADGVRGPEFDLDGTHTQPAAVGEALARMAVAA